MTTNVDKLVNVNPTITTTKPGRMNCGMMYSSNELSATKIALERRLVCVPAQPRQQKAPKINQRKRGADLRTLSQTPTLTQE
jgi:hypothetical protein